MDDRGGATRGVIYGLGFLGSIIYYIQHANSVLEGFIGVLKAAVWPAIFVYKLFEYLNK